MDSKIYVAAARFFALAEAANRNGGTFFCSTSGGTINVAAGEISHRLDCAFKDARHALDVMGQETMGVDWYCELSQRNGWLNSINMEHRWSVKTIARAAAAPLSGGKKGEAK